MFEIEDKGASTGKSPIILDTNEKAATYRTDIHGWVSRNGNFYGQSKEMAQWDGCTHVPCKSCGEPTPKQRLQCPKCRLARETALYNAREARAWDGVAMLYSEKTGEYFNDLETAEDLLEKGETLVDLRLIICEPVYLHEINTDYWEDDLGEEGDLPEDVYVALDALNQAIQDADPVSWEPGRFRLLLE